MTGKDVDHLRQGLAHRQADVVHQRHWCCAGAAVAGIHGDEVGGAGGTAPVDFVTQVLKPLKTAENRLEPGGLAGDLADMADQVKQFAVGIHLGMTVRRDRVLASRYAADFGDFPGDLAGRQDAALARFGTLCQLQFDHLNLIVAGDVPQAVITQVAVGVAHAVFGRADLKNHIATALKMIGRQAALAGVEPTSGQFGAARQGTHGGHRQGAEAHRRNVDDRLGGVRLAAIGAYDHFGSLCGLLAERRIGAVDENRRANGTEVAGRTEGNGVVDALGRFLHPIALGPVERHFLTVHGKEILPEELAQGGEQAAKSADNRVIAAHRVMGLCHIDGEQHDDSKRQQADDHNEQRRQEVEAAGNRQEK